MDHRLIQMLMQPFQRGSYNYPTGGGHIMTIKITNMVIAQNLSIASVIDVTITRVYGIV